MAVDYAEKEREFLESLAEDTGRDLAGWMAAITATSLQDRNAIIDWLRQQGFLFAKASWLERIFHNGGRPIYFDPAAPVATVRQTNEPAPPPALPAAPVASPAELPARATPPVVFKPISAGMPIAQAVVPPSANLLLDVLLAEAKAYRPLAHYILREIEKNAPDAIFEARNGYVAVLRYGLLAGVLTISPKELRLGLAGRAGTSLPPELTKAKFAKSHPDMPAAISHMLILTDVRQVTPDVVAAVVQAVDSA